ncbi:uncharacterized protein SAPINGB_P000941 [Magnusiomyces paraingens]|uniref:phosphoadenylyl-sulfate reductase (thioredoxin) n=1 Tax=Magnusiomyces paraingens TaxID=2606893 RepID=A0A5E8B9D2_9ASCO|nr:uncharacterized protein SAPINGB_P000941 [Saprochaete ingens]VVT45888.1 unnamed protein product [Saprochaete ingens]
MTKDTIELSPSHLEYINTNLSTKTAEEILQWSLTTFPGLFQTTAFGLTGLVILDMISKISPGAHPIDLIFMDTLHHFKETLELVDRVKAKYPQIQIHIYKPEGVNTEEEFAREYGEKLWDTNDTFYDYLVKVEPASRAYEDLGVKAAITGRRRSQGGARAKLQAVEYEADTKLIKINPLFNWTFQQVQQYIKENDIPYNALLDQGYRSVGDYHSTVPVKEGEDERAGRWKGKQKTECGIHETSRFAEFLAARNQQPQAQS